MAKGGGHTCPCLLLGGRCQAWPATQALNPACLTVLNRPTNSQTFQSGLFCPGLSLSLLVLGLGLGVLLARFLGCPPGSLAPGWPWLRGILRRRSP